MQSLLTALAALLEIARCGLMVLVIRVDGDGEAGETSEMRKGGRVIWGGIAVSINASQSISSAMMGIEYSSGVCFRRWRMDERTQGQ